MTLQTQSKDMTYIYVIRQATSIAKNLGTSKDNPYPCNTALHDVWSKAFEMEVVRLDFFSEEVCLSDMIEWKREGF